MKLTNLRRFGMGRLINRVSHSDPKNPSIPYSAIVVSLACITLTVGCASTRITEPSGPVAKHQVPIDLVSKIVEYVRVDTLTLSEKFELYFQGKLKRYPHPLAPEVIRFESTADASGISISGSGERKETQLATIYLKRNVECILPRTVKERLPNLERHYESDTFRDWGAEELTNTLYAGYVFTNKLGYSSFHFEDDKCLRWVGTSQKSF